MNSEAVRAIRQFLFRRESCFLAILPYLISLLTIQYQGTVATLIVVCIYYVIISFFLKTKSIKYFALSLAFFIAIDLALIALTPQEWAATASFLRSLRFPLPTFIICVCFSLAGKPYPQLTTEAIYPELKAWDFSKTKSYTRIFQKISLIWITGSLVQILSYLYLYLAGISEDYFIRLLLGWPFYACLMILSILYATRQFAKY